MFMYVNWLSLETVPRFFVINLYFFRVKEALFSIGPGLACIFADTSDFQKWSLAIGLRGVGLLLFG